MNDRVNVQTTKQSTEATPPAQHAARSTQAGAAPALAGAPVARAVIQITHVTKKFDETVGVDDLSFEVHEGEIFGFIGPSGSGKTTTMRLITGIYTPTSGTVSLLGANPAHPTRRLHAGFGYMPQQFVLYPNLSVYENINFMASVYGLGWRTRHARIKNLLQFVELWEARHRLAENISGGMQRRLELAGALIHNPRLLFVDEPTAGIDPVLRGKVWEEFRRLRATPRRDGTRNTIFVTTQYVGESEYCDRVGVIRKGKLVALGTPLELRRQAMEGDVVDLESPNLSADIARLLYEQPFIQKQAARPVEWRNYPNTLRLRVANAGDAIPQILAALQGPGVEVTALQEYRPSFDEVFIKLVGNTSEED